MWKHRLAHNRGRKIVVLSGALVAWLGVQASPAVAQTLFESSRATANTEQVATARADTARRFSPGVRRPIRPPKPPKKSRGSPGPIAGMGLPALLLAGGAYWVVRRRRNRVYEV